MKEILKWGLILAVGWVAPAAPAIEVLRLAPSEKIVLDGRFDEPAWSRAPWFDRFREIYPQDKIRHACVPKCSLHTTTMHCTPPSGFTIRTWPRCAFHAPRQGALRPGHDRDQHRSGRQPEQAVSARENTETVSLVYGHRRGLGATFYLGATFARTRDPDAGVRRYQSEILAKGSWTFDVL